MVSCAAFRFVPICAFAVLCSAMAARGIASEPFAFPPPEGFVWRGGAAEAVAGPQLLLGDGSLLVAEVYEINGERVLAGSRVLGEVEIPIARLRGILWQPPSEPGAREAARRAIREARGRYDEIHLENGDRITGLLGPLAEFGEVLTLETDAGRVDAPLDRVTGMIYNPALAAAPIRAPQWELGFRDGSILYAESLSPSGEGLEIQLAGDIQIGIPSAEEFLGSTLVHMRALSPEILYLSELEPAGYKHVPFLSREWPYQMNRSALGGLLRTGGGVHPAGIGMHSTARLTFAVPAGYSKFVSEIAVDDAANGGGSVVFRVFLSYEGQWREAYRSPVVRGGEALRKVELDLGGAQGISLVVDFADRADQGDYADWLYPRLFK